MPMAAADPGVLVFCGCYRLTVADIQSRKTHTRTRDTGTRVQSDSKVVSENSPANRSLCNLSVNDLIVLHISRAYTVSSSRLL